MGAKPHTLSPNALPLAEARRAREPIDDDEGALLAAPDPAPSPQRVAGGLDLERALARLGPGERLCVAPAHGEGMTHAEIAEATGLALERYSLRLIGAALQSLPWSRFRTANRFPRSSSSGRPAVGPGGLKSLQGR